VTDTSSFAERYLDSHAPSMGAGKSPAVLVVDFIEGFTNAESPLGGDWDAPVRNAARMLRAARAASVPVIFTTVEFLPEEVPTLLMALKTPQIAVLTRGSKWCEVDHRLSRQERDLVVSKKYGSAFFGTSLASQLHVLGVDTLLIGGCVTSGCVRASAVDAVQNGFRPLVVREAVGDRSELANEANLLDIERRYGDVVTLDEAIAIIEDLQ
jgi:nicotinamidase-related amidase